MELLLIILYLLANILITIGLSLYKSKISLPMLFAVEMLLAEMLINFKIECGSYILVIGSINFAFVSMISDIINEIHGVKQATNATICSTIILIVYTVLCCFLFYLSEDESIKKHFITQINVVLVDIVVSYLFTQLLNVFVFDALKKKSKGKWIWLRSFLSTFISQVINACLFYEIIFFRTYDQIEIFKIIVGSLLFKLFIALIEVPIIYIISFIRKSISNKTINSVFEL